MTAILTSLAMKLPIAFLERYLTYLEKVGDTGTERLRAMLEEILETKKLQTQIIIAEQNHWYTAMIRPLIATPIIIFMWKVIVWDKVLGWGVTDPLGPEMAWAFTAIIGAYFIARPFEKSNMASKARDIVENVKRNWKG
jgi:hypothetical protein